MFFFGKKEEERPVSGQLEIDLIMSIRRAVEKTTSKMFEFKLDDKPKIDQKPTVMWEGRMKASKPSDCVFVSAVVVERENKTDNGIFILYIPDSVAESIAGMLGKKKEEGIMEACGEFLKSVVDYFTNHLVKLGYEQLKFSEPMNFSHKVEELFPYFRSTKYDLVFYRKGEKFVQAEVGIGPFEKIHETPKEG